MEPRLVPNDLARWLRRRRKRKLAREMGEMVSPGDPDFYGPDDLYGADAESGDDFPVGGCLSVVAIAVAVIVVGFFVVRALTGGEETIGSPPVTAATTTSSAGAASSSTTGAVSTSTSSSTTQPQLIGDEVLTGILQALGVDPNDEIARAGLQDLLGDLIDSIRELIPSYQGRDVDIARVIALLLDVTQSWADGSFNQSVYECGALDPLVICPPTALDMPAGEVLVVAMQVDAPIPIASTERSYRYSIVFDTDGDPANDWQYIDPFEWDYFQGTDRWYQAVYDHLTGSWTIDVTQLEADGSFPNAAAPSAVRLVVSDRWAVWFIPVSELGGAPAPYRVTAFGHDGQFSEASRGGDGLGAACLLSCTLGARR